MKRMKCCTCHVQTWFVYFDGFVHLRSFISESVLALMTSEQRHAYFDVSQAMNLAPLMSKFDRRILQRDQLKKQLIEPLIEQVREYSNMDR